ncbi:50S ribosomal protein L28 [Candidatus Berkelbacteria bacterium]|nr:50S ribosomal protein L28 [Candidatus Berkelbacteria bacterium]
MRVCKICGKGSIRGVDISYSHRRHLRRRYPNLQGGICTRCLKQAKKELGGSIKEIGKQPVPVSS